MRQRVHRDFIGLNVSLYQPVRRLISLITPVQRKQRNQVANGADSSQSAGKQVVSLLPAPDRRRSNRRSTGSSVAVAGLDNPSGSHRALGPPETRQIGLAINKANQLITIQLQASDFPPGRTGSDSIVWAGSLSVRSICSAIGLIAGQPIELVAARLQHCCCRRR